ncbi:aminoacyl-tRNA hydrolase [Candidatus Beckwithbacteria bacterium]|nr:aminoacyl-tRNA hydrolase [Candidatus Beckwithbacteria bacterium]
MKVLVGLGNPEEKFHYNRHNVGFLFLDFVASKNQENHFNLNKKCQALILQKPDYLLVKPQTFMNSSGLAVAKILKFANLTSKNLILIHDDLDLPFGDYKISPKGPRVHNGVNSVTAYLKTDDFVKIRIGIAGKTYDLVKKSGESMADNYVLKDFLKEEQEQLTVIFTKIYHDLLLINT